MTTQCWCYRDCLIFSHGLFKNGPIMSCKLQLAKELTILSRDNDVDINLFAS